VAFIILKQAIRKIVWNFLIFLHSTIHIFSRLFFQVFVHSFIILLFFVHISFLPSYFYSPSRPSINPSIHYSSPIHSSVLALMEPTIKSYSVRCYIRYDSYWFYKAVFQLISRITKAPKMNKSYDIILRYLQSAKSVSHMFIKWGMTSIYRRIDSVATPLKSLAVWTWVLTLYKTYFPHDILQYISAALQQKANGFVVVYFIINIHYGYFKIS
jgi:hypothetical protein